MSLASNIAPHLPYLRRFSRALTGSQTGGDAYVVEVLEALIEDPDSLDGTLDARGALYQLYCRMWESVPVNMKQTSPGFSDRDRAQWASKAHEHIATIPPKARQAFLLLAVEGFSPDEIATILGRSRDQVMRLVEEASRSIIEQVATTVLIIEDEPLISMDLQDIVESLGHRVTGVATTQREARRLAGKSTPGLILADIQLADGSSGIDAVNDILQSTEAPVIFVTAFPERLLTGTQPEPTFLITKPFTTEMVRAVVSQALFFDNKARAA